VNPAWSILLFTALAGAAQGLVVVLAVAVLAGAVLPASLLVGGLGLSTVLLVVALVASFFHLGRPMQAWRAVLMWRTSWMSREVIVLPAFIALVAGWGALAAAGSQGVVATRLLPLAIILVAALLWYCTAMIYACLRFIQEWAHPVTIANYTLIGLASGLVLGGALAVVVGDAGFALKLGPWAIGATLLAWAVRGWSLHRNARLKPRSTLQSATGIRNPRLVQTAMGMTGGSFNTREFFHRATLAGMRHMKLAFQVLAFAVPVALVALALAGAAALPWLLAVPVQLAGVLAERWVFFAQARHPQNLYYQVVS